MLSALTDPLFAVVEFVQPTTSVALHGGALFVASILVAKISTNLSTDHTHRSRFQNISSAIDASGQKVPLATLEVIIPELGNEKAPVALSHSPKGHRRQLSGEFCTPNESWHAHVVNCDKNTLWKWQQTSTR